MSSFRRSQRLRLAAAAATCDFTPGETVVQKGEIIDFWKQHEATKKQLQQLSFQLISFLHEK
jgi:hypothetical protein